MKETVLLDNDRINELGAHLASHIRALESLLPALDALASDDLTKAQRREIVAKAAKDIRAYLAAGALQAERATAVGIERARHNPPVPG